MDTFNLVSLFSGIGGFELGLKQIGGTCVYASDIDRNARKVYFTNFGIIPYYDIRDIDLLPQHELIVGGFPCFIAGTMIVTDTGHRPIEELMKGDLVLTHKGRWRKIVDTFKSYNTIKYLKAQAMPLTGTTKEHPYYACLRSTGKYRKRVFSELEWIEAKDITADHFVSNILPDVEDTDNHNEGFWWIIGRFLGDGWTIKRYDRKSGGRVIICCGFHEADQLQKELEIRGYHGCPAKEKTGVKFHICNKELYEFCLRYGQGAENKHLTRLELTLPKHKAKALLDGYLSADGHNDKNGSNKSASTSQALILDMAIIVQRAYSVVPCIVFRERKKHTCVIEGRTVNQKDYWTMDIPKSNRSAVYSDEYILRKVKPAKCKVKRTVNQPVYNIAVEEDNTYLANNAIVHNCYPFSSNNNGKDDPSGFEHSLGGLIFDVINIIKKFQPKGYFLENVGGISKYIPAIEPHFKKLGYSFCYKKINSLTVVPQNRPRYYFVGFRNKQKFEFPDFNGPNLTIESIIEKGIDKEKLKIGEGTVKMLERRKAENHEWHQDPRTKDQHAYCFVGSGRYNFFNDDGVIRWYSAIESKRLMGFPDDFILPEPREPSYRLLGNAVIPKMIERIGIRIKDYL